MYKLNYDSVIILGTSLETVFNFRIGSINDTAATLLWDRPEIIDFDSYVVKYRLANSTEVVIIRDIPNNDTSLMVSELTPEEDYVFMIYVVKGESRGVLTEMWVTTSTSNSFIVGIFV